MTSLRDLKDSPDKHQVNRTSKFCCKTGDSEDTSKQGFPSDGTQQLRLQNRKLCSHICLLDTTRIFESSRLRTVLKVQEKSQHMAADCPSFAHLTMWVTAKHHELVPLHFRILFYPFGPLTAVFSHDSSTPPHILQVRGPRVLEVRGQRQRGPPRRAGCRRRPVLRSRWPHRV